MLLSGSKLMEGFSFTSNSSLCQVHWKTSVTTSDKLYMLNQNDANIAFQLCNFIKSFYHV